MLIGLDGDITAAKDDTDRQKELRLALAAADQTTIPLRYVLRLLRNSGTSPEEGQRAFLESPDRLAEHMNRRLARLDELIPGGRSQQAAFLLDHDLAVTTPLSLDLTRQARRWRADRLGLDEAQFGELGNEHWFDEREWTRVVTAVLEDIGTHHPEEGWDSRSLWTLAAELDSSVDRLTGYVQRIGQVPTELSKLAAEHGVHDPARLFLLAVRMRIDPLDIGRRDAGERDPRGKVWPLVAEQLNAGDDRQLAVEGAERVLRTLAEQDPQYLVPELPQARGGRSLPAELLTVSRALQALPHDLVTRARRADVAPYDLLEAAALAGPADPAAVAAYARTVPPAVVAVLTPARLATGYRDWSDMLLTGFGIAESEIMWLDDKLGERNKTLDLTDLATPSSRNHVDALRAAASGDIYQERIDAIVRAATDPAAALTELTAFVERVVAAGRLEPPLQPVQLPESSVVRITITDGVELIESVLGDRVLGRHASMLLTETTTDWTLLAPLLRALEDIDVAFEDVRLSGEWGRTEIRGFGQLRPVEAQALIVAAGMSGGDRDRALHMLGWQVLAGASDDGGEVLARTVLPTPAPAALEAFGDGETRTLAMLAVAAGRRPGVVDAIYVRGDATPDDGLERLAGWQQDPSPADTSLVTAVTSSAVRQGVPLPDGVTGPAALLAHAADVLDSGTVTLPPISMMDAHELAMDAIPADHRRTLLTIVRTRQADAGLTLDAAWVRRYITAYYDVNPGLPGEKLVHRHVAAADAGGQLSHEQVYAEILRDPVLAGRLRHREIKEVLAHTLGVRLMTVFRSGSTELAAGPAEASELYVHSIEGGYAGYGPPLPPIGPEALKAGRQVWRWQHLVVAGDRAAWTGGTQLLGTLIRASAGTAGRGRPVLVIEGAGRDRHHDELTTLGSLIHRYHALDHIPVVVATDASKDLIELLTRTRTPSVVRTAAKPASVWVTFGPSGARLHQDALLTVRHFDEIPPPPARAANDRRNDAGRAWLDGWLSTPSWREAQRYLSAGLEDRLSRYVARSMTDLLSEDPFNRELRAYEVLLDLARQNSPALTVAFRYLTSGGRPAPLRPTGALTPQQAAALTLAVTDGPDPVTDVQVHMVRLPQTDGPNHEKLLAHRSVAQLRAILDGIRHDHAEGYGARVRAELPAGSDAQILFANLNHALLALDPSAGPETLRAELHDVLLSIDQVHEEIRLVLGAAAEVPEVEALVARWSAPPAHPGGSDEAHQLRINEHAAERAADSDLKTGLETGRRAHLTIIGTPDPSLLDRITQLSANPSAGSWPVLVVGAVAPDSRELTALGSLVRRYRSGGREPRVVATELTEALTETLSRSGVIAVTRTPSGMSQTWRVTGSDGRVRAEATDLGPEHFTSPGVHVTDRTPAVELVDGWLDTPRWAETGEYLAGHLSELLGADATAVLAERLGTYPDNRELHAYEVVLDLARQAGGLGTAFGPLDPGVHDEVSGLERVAPDGPLSPLVAVRYLEPKDTLAQRRAWNDQLLSLLFQGKITGTQAAKLARGVLTPDGTTTPGLDAALTYARVVEGVGMMLSLTPEEAAQPLENDTYAKALHLVENCVVTPNERWMNVLRLARGRDLLQERGLPGVFEAGQAGPYLDNLRVLTETFSNC